MSIRKQLYICPTCKATKEIRAHPTQSNESFEQELPDDLPCGWHGCKHRAIKIEELERKFKPKENDD